MQHVCHVPRCDRGADAPDHDPDRRQRHLCRRDERADRSIECFTGIRRHDHASQRSTESEIKQRSIPEPRPGEGEQPESLSAELAREHRQRHQRNDERRRAGDETQRTAPHERRRTRRRAIGRCVGCHQVAATFWSG